MFFLGHIGVQKSFGHVEKNVKGLEDCFNFNRNEKIKSQISTSWHFYVILFMSHAVSHPFFFVKLNHAFSNGV